MLPVRPKRLQLPQHRPTHFPRPFCVCIHGAVPSRSPETDQRKSQLSQRSAKSVCGGSPSIWD
jgi:hypothetical protein